MPRIQLDSNIGSGLTDSSHLYTYSPNNTGSTLLTRTKSWVEIRLSPIFFWNINKTHLGGVMRQQSTSNSFITLPKHIGALVAFFLALDLPLSLVVV